MKKHLSRIVFQRMLMLFIGSFSILMAITIIYFVLYGKNKIGEEMKTFLTHFSEETFDNYMRELTEDYAEGVDKGLTEKGISFFDDPKFQVKSAEMLESGWCSEWNIIDENGIIIASSKEDYVGYDMHSGEQSAEFLCLLEGADYYSQDFREISYDNNTRMLYVGAPVHSIGGFVQMGFDEEMYQEIVRDSVVGHIATSHVGIDGYMLFLNDENEVITSSGNRFDGETLILSKSLEDIASQEKEQYEDVFGIKTYVEVIPYKDYYVLEGMPLSEVYAPYNVTLVTLVMVYAAVFAVLFLLIRHLINSQVVKGVYSLDGTLSRIMGGNLEEKADFRNSIEFDGLSDGINHTVGRLKQMISEAEKKMEEELAFAKEIQTSAVPTLFPPFPEKESFGLYALMDTAKAVGGDFYDFFLINDQTLALVIADVSDKGMPAALFMMRAKTLIKTYAEQGLPVEEVASKVNAALCEENSARMFVTAWIGFLNLGSGNLSFVHAGHTNPLIFGKTGAWYLDRKKNAMLGSFDYAVYERQEMELHPGESLLLYTDGVTEAMNPEGELYGEHRLLKLVRKIEKIGETDRNQYAESQCRRVYEDVKNFAGSADQSDDITLLWFYLAETEDVGDRGRFCVSF